jgi:prepilin-type N-terminal cleavage/methylation domain-containing protein
MQTLLYQKNKNPNQKIKHSEKGFTLIECILAVGILSIVVASIVGLQSSIISVTQIATDGMRASWAVRSTIAQMQYLIETQGQANLPENTTLPWVTDNQFIITVNRTELKDVKISQFLTSAMGVYNIVNPAGNENLDTERMFSSINNVLDQDLTSNSKGFFSNFTINVKWNSGLIPKTISEGFFFIDNDTFKGISDDKESGGDTSGGTSNGGSSGGASSGGSGSGTGGSPNNGPSGGGSGGGGTGGPK